MDALHKKADEKIKALLEDTSVRWGTYSDGTVVAIGRKKKGKTYLLQGMFDVKGKRTWDCSRTLITSDPHWTKEELGIPSTTATAAVPSQAANSKTPKP